MTVLGTKILAEAGSFAQSFRAAKPFRHLVIEDFLAPDLGQRMLADFPRFEDRYALNEMGEVGGKAVRMNVREISDTYRSLDRYLQTREFLDFVSVVTGIPDLLYDPDYIGGGTHENRDGQGLDQHVDFNFHPGTRWHRRLNLIVYLNPEWDEAWGGNLQLQADPWNGDASGQSIAPLFNRAVIFETTERSWHGFSSIHLPADKRDLSRKSFAIYLYTKERPPEETAASHATVYVPDGMPADLVPGVTLDAARVADLHGRFERMFGQLKFLYEREKHFASQIAAMEGALTQARDALRVPLQGYAVQAVPPLGMWPDRWVGKEFCVTFTPQRKARGVELELWAPDQLSGDQVLDIEILGKRWAHRVARGSRSQFSLDVKLSSGTAVELKIRSRCFFSPAAIGQSADDRELAWMLLGIALSH
ncbi:MAG: 2OG-Fe(II) oxygenase [Proteobacteria bacterium]|nr:2OG-Fe(II) oxygenase [Pseudomonadota bacterium]